MKTGSNTAIRELKGLGPASEAMLAPLAISTAKQLYDLGAIEVFLRLEELNGKPPSLNLLYAMVGAIEDRPWQEVAKQDRSRLLTELDGAREYRALKRDQIETD